MAEWPATLPARPRPDEYSERSEDVKLRTAMDAGPPKMRRRISRNVRPVHVAFDMDSTELGYFDEFHDTTLYGGTLPFTWTHPRFGEAEWQMASIPEIRSNGTEWIVSFDLEKLP